jgi:D-serine deaminase-like pyridoxal phosphate-dependent protein
LGNWRVGEFATVSNLVDAVHLIDGDAIVDTLPVAARGRIQ